MTKDEALKMAHKSFMQLNERYPRRDNGDGYFDKEIQACKEALEHPAQEPVAWMDSEGRFRLDFKTEIVRSIAAVNKEIPLYTHPAPSWQGLSDDEIWDIANFLGKNKEWDYPVMFAKTIEQALKEKNT